MADKHIKLIVTGDSEKNALHKSLQSCFPAHTKIGDLVVWDTPRKADGVTNFRIQSGRPSRSMTTLVNVMFTEALQSKQPDGTAPDFVIVIDDVELGNVGREDFVVHAFRLAVDAKLAELRSANSLVEFQQIQTRIQRCCSFHLLCPMVEAYFFADPKTLTSGGVSADKHPVLVHPTDVEQFDAILDSHPDWQSSCQLKNTQQKAKNPWWRTERHPKHYLTHLLSISQAPAYHETTLGARMIEETHWPTVAKTPTDSPIVSALLEDIWDWYGLPPPPDQCVGIPSPTMYRVKTTPPLQRTLRNL
jgi:hypothetical protein